jgi:hypothetical protein
MSVRQSGRRPGGLRGIGPGILLLVAWIFLSGKPRSLAEDADLVVGLMDPSPRVDGLHFVPPRGAFALVANHYQRGRWWVGWAAAAITHAVAGARDAAAREIHWVALSEWRWFELGGLWVPHPLTSILFQRAARIWGLITMPSRPSDVAGRARALRQVLLYLGRSPDGEDAPAAVPVCLFPEGRASVELLEALPGTGALLARLSSRGVPLLPAGVYEEDEGLVVRFGAPFCLGKAPAGSQSELDSWARERVMVAIGRLLPPQLWGAYAEAIGTEDAGPALR